MKKLFFICIWIMISSFSQQCSIVEAVSADKGEQEQLEEVKEPGTYPIKIYYEKNEQTIEKIVYITVTGSNTVIGTTGTAIDATDFTVGITDIAHLEPQDWIESANAKAWSTKDGEELMISYIDTTKIVDKVGDYPISFQTMDDIKITVTAKVIENRDQETVAYLKNKKGKLTAVNKAEKSLNWEGFILVQRIVLTLLIVIIMLIPIIALLAQFYYTRELVYQILEALQKKE